MAFYYTEPLCPLNSYDGKTPLRGTVNGAAFFSNPEYTNYPLGLVDATGNFVAELAPVEGFGWRIEFSEDPPANRIPSLKVHLETVEPVPLPLGYLGITEMKINETAFDVSVEGTRLILTERKPQ